jgi:hypothetical protein
MSNDTSFRGADTVREPGTYEHGPVIYEEGPCAWVPGLPLQGIPE